MAAVNRPPRRAQSQSWFDLRYGMARAVWEGQPPKRLPHDLTRRPGLPEQNVWGL